MPCQCLAVSLANIPTFTHINGFAKKILSNLYECQFCWVCSKPSAFFFSIRNFFAVSALNRAIIKTNNL